jgi:ABC-2 type transport system ATP-binding protein
LSRERFNAFSFRMSAIIQAHEVSRWYGIVMGLNNVTFTIEPGLTGLVGPNGAGKSTLIQMITGQLQPSSGSLTVFEQTPWNNPRLLQRLGYVPEREAVPKELRPLDWLRGLALLSGLAPAQAESRSVAGLERVKLPREHWGKRMSQYSKGMKQRVKLAQALLHEPDLLVLDEPMNGLDPMGRQEMAQLLGELAASGTSVLISSHILAELESLCKSILILNWGRVLASGSQKEIRGDLKNWSEQLSVRCSDPEALARHLFNAGVLLGFDLEAEAGVLNIRVKDPGQFYEQWAELLLHSGVTVFEIRSQSRSLKQIFEKVTA